MRGIKAVFLLMLMALAARHRPVLARDLQAPKPEWVVVLSRGVSASSSLDCKPSPAAALAKEADRPRASSTSSSSSSGVCRVCGGPPAVAAACSAHPRCVAFVMDAGDPGCGHLKSGTDRQVPSQAQTLFCNTARGAKCTGQFSFTPQTGMMFTGDYSCPQSPAAGAAVSPSPLCFLPGAINSVAAACLQDARCQAFAFNRADQGGYFKSSAGVASRTEGSDLYRRI